MSAHDLTGKNVQRRRVGDNWHYRFGINKKTVRGDCGTSDKSEAEDMAAKLKQGTRQASRAAVLAITAGEPFVLRLPFKEHYISNIDRRDIRRMLEEQIARLDPP
ncbi:hypothetical protein H8A95_18375 [Bradyrhizobium sp. Pear76]|uniref:hypothetical protein n=1 Tax=Bradyrhizobium oropedii TaxID=1571201 RepID=UPI001E48A007|nr:hypothetical protein [Bradyrhizobium oropedii]MCC8964231.1 hypothetical protein [Bradyrhizobium oropedii]